LLYVVATLAAIVFLVSYAFDEPVRRRLEQQMNANLVGYTAKIRRAHFHPFNFAITLKDTSILQDDHPNPPVATFPRLDASVHWRALLRLKLVADFRFDEPKIHVDRTKLMAEVNDKVDVEDRGWQAALESIYPLKINEFVIRDGEITYIEDTKSKPLKVDQIHLRATNIRNVRSREHTYPSDVFLTGRVFESGRFTLDGNADFMAEPYAGVKAAIGLDEMPLDRFKPVLERYNLILAKGRMNLDGDVEFSPTVKTADVRQIVLRDLDAGYVNRPARAEAAERLREETAEVAKEVANDPGILLKVERVQATHARLRFVNEALDPDYTLELNDAEVHIENVSNHAKRGPATGTIAGRFMNSGPTTASFAFRPEKTGPDFDLSVQIEDTELAKLNDLFRAYGNFDVTEGRFALYTELKIHDQRIDGYLKPMFADMKVYDRDQDRGEGVFHQVYERLVGGVAWLLENPPRDAVATKAKITGPMDNPNLSTLEVVLRLIQNAFFRAILPGFEESARDNAIAKR
jgi:hypothetical protein